MGCMTHKKKAASSAEIVREYGPFPGSERVNGVTFDGRHVWFAAGDQLRAFDPASGEAVRALPIAAHAGTAFDGRYLFQMQTTRSRRSIPKRVASWPAFQPPARAETRAWPGQLPAGMGLSGLESNGADLFYCGGGPSGTVRAVRRPKRASSPRR
jgi:hypothetical protein